MATSKIIMPYKIVVATVSVPTAVNISANGTYTLKTGITWHRGLVVPSFAFVPYALVPTNFYWSNSDNSYMAEFVNLRTTDVPLTTSDFFTIRYIYPTP